VAPIGGKWCIAQISPLTEAVPPKPYGGTERVISWLTEELVALGHDVTPFASGDSITGARFEPMWPTALRLDGFVRDPNALHMSMIEQVARRAKQFDLLHVHLDYYPFSGMSRQSTPFLTALHGRLDLPEHGPVFSTFQTVPVVSIWNSQRRLAPTRIGSALFIVGCPRASSDPFRLTRPISPFWAAFRRTSGLTEQFTSPNDVARRVRSQREPTRSITTISRR
jgi:glycosyltransferase involved in cell wall biosynthesis